MEQEPLRQIDIIIQKLSEQKEALRKNLNSFLEIANRTANVSGEDGEIKDMVEPKSSIDKLGYEINGIAALNEELRLRISDLNLIL